MSDSNLILTLGKVIIAAAWVDGDLTHNEINCMKDLLFRLPDLTGREWASLEMYIESPVGEAERERLVDQLNDEIQSNEDKKLAIRTLDNLLSADDSIAEVERTVIEEIKRSIESADVGILKPLSRLIRGSIDRRERALSSAPNREEYFEDYLKNKVYYGLRRRLEADDSRIDLPEGDLRKLSLLGGLMARVAHVDQEVDPGEFGAMVDLLKRGTALSESETALVAEVAIAEVSPDMDYYRLTREFFTSTTEKERVQTIDLLFAVADADGRVSNLEIEEIRKIARSLRLSHKQFIDAKLKIPRQRRDS